jgi:cobalt-zinc-cadmium efflux system outer membrane protein
MSHLPQSKWARRGAAVLASLLLVCASASLVRAQGTSSTSGNELTLRAALRLAQQQSPALQRVDAQADMAFGSVQTSGQWPNPTLEYRRENLGSPLLPDEFVTAYVPIDVTGRRIRLGRATEQARSRVGYERRAARRDVELEITRAWVEALLSADLRETLRRQKLAVDEIARVDSQRAREGVVAEAVAMRSRVEANRLAHEVAVAESRASRSRYGLATLIGVASEALPALPRIADAAASELRVDILVSDDTELIARARRDRADFTASSMAVEEAILRRRAERTGLFGDWQLQGGTKRTSGFMTGQVGLAVPLPLFNQSSGARLQTSAAERDALAAQRVLELQLVADVSAAADELRRLQRLGDVLQQSPRLAEDISSSARVSYAEGNMTLLELLDAHRAAADAERTMQQFYADLLFARATLARAIGAPLVSENTP